MSYSISTFTVEITGVPAIVFQTKWHGEAEDVCRIWAQKHWDQLATRGRYGLQLPPIIKVRLAHAKEKAAYELSGEGAEYCGDVRVVCLVDMTAPPWAHEG